MRNVCRDHEIAEALYYGWRDKLLEGGKLALEEAQAVGGPGDERTTPCSWSLILRALTSSRLSL